MRPQNPDRPLIIERPDLQTAAQRFGYFSLTFICWFVWLYLFVPMLSLLAWIVGASAIYQVMLQGLSVADFLETLRIYFLGILLLTSSYLAWAVSSYFRFRKSDRRGSPAPVSDARLAVSHHLTVEQLSSFQQTNQHTVSAQELDRMFADV